jgi:pyruvate dehydrogenase E1 component alpha subunit
MSIPIGTHALHAVGYAMGLALDEEPGVAVACIGDGATSEGDVHEALNFAAVYDAPCIFLVQNNQWAISVPLHEQTRSDSIAHKAVAYGMPGVRCDGNDVLATYAVIEAARRRASEGAGPTLIEAVTYRMEAHTTSDDATRYRSSEELELWEQLDPIRRYRQLLEHEGLLGEAEVQAAADRGTEAARRLRETVLAAPDADPDELFQHVFVDPTPGLLEQRLALRDELRRDDL